VVYRASGEAWREPDSFLSCTVRSRVEVFCRGLALGLSPHRYAARKITAQEHPNREESRTKRREDAHKCPIRPVFAGDQPTKVYPSYGFKSSESREYLGSRGGGVEQGRGGRCPSAYFLSCTVKGRKRRTGASLVARYLGGTLPQLHGTGPKNGKTSVLLPKICFGQRFLG
jgi:hypothetical protein